MTRKITDLEGRLDAALKRGDKKTKTQARAHTPGPWTLKAREPKYGGWEIGKTERVEVSMDAMTGRDLPPHDSFRRIALVLGRMGADWNAESEKDARLIAAAPELLDALKEAQRIIRECYEEIDSGYTDSDEIVMSQIRAAIAKAEGR